MWSVYKDFNAEMQRTRRIAKESLCETLRARRLCVEVFGLEEVWNGISQ
jgi:hypothetical protein